MGNSNCKSDAAVILPLDDPSIAITDSIGSHKSLVSTNRSLQLHVDDPSIVVSKSKNHDDLSSFNSFKRALTFESSLTIGSMSGFSLRHCPKIDEEEKRDPFVEDKKTAESEIDTPPRCNKYDVTKTSNDFIPDMSLPQLLGDFLSDADNEKFINIWDRDKNELNSKCFNGPYRNVSHPQQVHEPPVLLNTNSNADWFEEEKESAPTGEEEECIRAKMKVIKVTDKEPNAEDDSLRREINRLDSSTSSIESNFERMDIENKMLKMQLEILTVNLKVASKIIEEMKSENGPLEVFEV